MCMLVYLHVRVFECVCERVLLLVLLEHGERVCVSVCLPVLALTVGVAVARSVARALLELCRPGAAAGAVGALV
jgi:hypothetical protein